MRGGYPRGGESYGGIPHQYQNGGGHGQMVINMKTTVTTSGGSHNGLVVHSAVQSAGSPSTSNGSSSWIPPFSPDPPLPPRRYDDRMDMIRSNTSLHRSSPLPIQMVPSTSRESLNMSKPRPPSPPPSPDYSFKGRDSPPDEFIQPTKLVLNVFRPKTQEPLWQGPISRSEVSLSNNPSQGIQLSKNRALLNDALTTTTTVEVFRAPLNSETPPMISLTASPFGGNPLLVRSHGPSYEQWKSQSRQSLIGEDGVMREKGVQWKERLIEESDRRFRDGSDYDEIPPLPPTREVEYIHHDYRPKVFQPVTHPMIMSSSSPSSHHRHSREDLRSQPPPYPAPLSPLYIVPDRRGQSRNSQSVSPGQWSKRSFNGNEPERENETNGHREQRYHRRSKSSTRDDPSSASVRSMRHRSMSPGSRRSVNTFGGSQEFVLPAHSPIGSTLMLASPDPNELPGRPASARSQEIFALYQTRDAYNRIVDQL